MAIDLDIVTRLDRATVREAAREAQRYFEGAGLDTGSNFGDEFSKGLNAKTPEIQKAFDKVTQASGKLIVEQEKLNALKDKGNATDAKLIEQSQRVAKAYQDEESALRSANAALDNHETSLRQVIEATDNARDSYIGSVAAVNQATQATRALQGEETALQNMIRSGRADRESMIDQSNRVAAARRAEAEATKLAGEGYREMEQAMRRVGNGSGDGLSAFGATLGSLGRIAGPTAIGALVPAIEAVAAVAANASQSVLLLPAAIGAVGAAVGTLKLATQGFGEAIEAIGDPEKFAEALESLSPSAANAALSIRALMPEFDQLRLATQESLFAGMGDQITQLTSTYLPMVQQMTTGIASAFNSMLSGVSTQLMTPETQASMQAFLSNVSTAFQALAPAAAPLTSAFAQLMEVGSGALPRIAEAASSAAASFNAFITEASRSGELQQWLDSGLSALSQLGDLAFTAGAAFMSLAPAGERILPDLVNVLEFAITGMSQFIDFGSQFGPLTTSLSVVSAGVDQISSRFEALSKVVETVGNIIAPILDRVRQAIDKVLDPIRKAIDVANKFGAGIPQIPQSSGGGVTIAGAGTTVDKNAGGIGSGTGFGGLGGGVSPFGGRNTPGYGVPQTTAGIGSATTFGMMRGTWDGSLMRADYDPVKEAEAATKAAAADASAAPPPQFDSSQWQVDPSATLANGAGPTPTMAPAGAGPGGYVVDQNRVLSLSESLGEARLRLLELESQTNVKQSTLVAARNNVNQLERDLIEAQQGTWKKANNAISGAMGDLQSIFAPMDEDFGISGGLPGVAKWLVTFLGNMALGSAIGSSPELQAAAMSMVADGSSKGSTGYGASVGGGFGMPGYGGGASGYPGDEALLAGVPAGRYSQEAGRDLLKGVSDCSSSIGDLVAILDGKDTTAVPNLTTGNAASMLPGMGFVRGTGGPGDFRVGYNSGHMQATLPGGTPWNWGSDSSAARRGIGGTGADDPAFTDHWYRPVGASAGPMTPAAGASPVLGLSGGTGPVGGGGTQSVFVVNMPSAGFIPGGASPGMPPAPTPSAMGPDALQPPATPGVGTGPAPGPAGWGAGAGLPNIIPGSAGQGFLGMQQQPGVGSAAGQSYSGLAQSASGGGGKGGIGLNDSMMAMAGGAADLVAPGSSIALKLANRAIQYGGQVAAIGVSGALETFLPHGSGLGDPGKSWLGKIAGGIAGARPAAPNQAGKSAPPQQGAQGGQSQQVNNDNRVMVDKMETGGGDGQGVANDIGRMQQQQYSAGGPR